MNCTDFEDAKGNVDWDAYHKHQVDVGDICMTCGTWMLNLNLFGNKREPAPQDCSDCRDIKASDDEVTHDNYVRCPKCKHRWNPGDCDDYQFYAEGEHEAWCGECDHKFEISTHVKYTFTSPPLVKEDDSG